MMQKTFSEIQSFFQMKIARLTISFTLSLTISNGEITGADMATPLQK